MMLLFVQFDKKESKLIMRVVAMGLSESHVMDVCCTTHMPTARCLVVALRVLRANRGVNEVDEMVGLAFVVGDN